MNDLATEAFNLGQDNEARVEATKLKLVAVLMTKVFSYHNFVLKCITYFDLLHVMATFAELRGYAFGFHAVFRLAAVPQARDRLTLESRGRPSALKVQSMAACM